MFYKSSFIPFNLLIQLQFDNWYYLCFTRFIVNLMRYFACKIRNIKAQTNIPKFDNQMIMDIQQRNCQEYLQDKAILLTGCTGFVGKVLLEKILRDFLPKRVYVLVRAKNNESSVQSRFLKQIIASRCFDRLRQERGQNFLEYIQKQVVPIQGDLLQEGLGLSVGQKQELIDSVNVIVNCAASVEFNLPLKQALDINFYGSVRMMELALQCKQLNMFIHVSTAYVNSNQRGQVSETIYNEKSNVLQYVNQLYNQADKMTDKEIQKLLNGLPNTYTFTKNLAEQMYKQMRPVTLPLSIVRPSIVGCSLFEPEPGWIDSFAASSAVLLNAGNGLLKVYKCNTNYQSCHIPVDILVNQIIAVASQDSQFQQFKIYHSGSSDRNPNYFFWKSLDTQVKEFWLSHKINKRISEPRIVCTNSAVYSKLKQLQYKVMLDLQQKLADSFGSDELQKQAALNIKHLNKSNSLANSYEFFSTREWIFKSSNMLNIINNLDASDKQVLNVDTLNIDWSYYNQLFCYGIQKYLLGEGIHLEKIQQSDQRQMRPRL
ncbi:hypothetical protein pb186bvf_009965 [Paramecium bursaria]